jgi:NAD(P)-dependent dehydrogenase (short-subunit alcohol dehydrogenase family)
VTGASRGIGLATAKVLAQEGAHVFGAARHITAELSELGPHAYAVDLSQPGGAEELVEHVTRKSERLDILVNNVGAGDAVALGGFLDVTDEQWRANLDVTLMSAVRMSRAAVPFLMKSRGAIVNVSSINSKVPSAGPVAYTIAKTALTALSKSLAEEFGPEGVRVNTVSPGALRTSLWDGKDRFGSSVAAALGVEHEAFLSEIPARFQMTTGRITEADEVANLIAFLVSDRIPNVVETGFPKGVINVVTGAGHPVGPVWIDYPGKLRDNRKYLFPFAAS